MAFPTSTPSYQGFTSTDTLQHDNHAAQHNQEQADIIALSNKVGTGASTPTNNTVLRSNGTGTTAYDQVHLATDVSGLLPTSSYDTIGMLKLVYPVGCIYAETTGINPATTFGFGTWSQTGQGRVLVGQGTSDQLFTAGVTGGESNHILVSNEMPSHTHTDSGHTHTVGDGSGFVSGGATGSAASITQTGAAFKVNTNTTSGIANLSNTGGGASHNNLQPYQVVYYWQRTA